MKWNMNRKFGLVAICLLIAISCMCIIRLIRKHTIVHNETWVIGGLKTIAACQTDHYNNTKPSTFTGDLSILCDPINPMEGPAFIESWLTTGQLSGYRFNLSVSCQKDNGAFSCWSSTAWPIVYGRTGIRSFYIDETTVIRALDIGGVPANINLPSVE